MDKDASPSQPVRENLADGEWHTQTSARNGQGMKNSTRCPLPPTPGNKWAEPLVLETQERNVSWSRNWKATHKRSEELEVFLCTLSPPLSKHLPTAHPGPSGGFQKCLSFGECPLAKLGQGTLLKKCLLNCERPLHQARDIFSLQSKTAERSRKWKWVLRQPRLQQRQLNGQSNMTSTKAEVCRNTRNQSNTMSPDHSQTFCQIFARSSSVNAQQWRILHRASPAKE